MLSINKKQALKMRKDLLSMSAVKKGNSYSYELLHTSGNIYALVQLDSPNPLTHTSLEGMVSLANFLQFERFGIRLCQS